MNLFFKKFGIVIATVSLVGSWLSAFLSLFGPGLAPALILSSVSLAGTCVGAILGARRTALVSLLTISPLFVLEFYPFDDFTLMCVNVAMAIITLPTGYFLLQNYRVSVNDIGFKKAGIVMTTVSFIVVGFAVFLSMSRLIYVLYEIALISACVVVIFGVRRTRLVSFISDINFKKAGIVITTVSFIVAGFAVFLSMSRLGFVLSGIVPIGTCVGAIFGARRTALMSLLVVSPMRMFPWLLDVWPSFSYSYSYPNPYYSRLVYANMAMMIIALPIGYFLFQNYRASTSVTKNVVTDHNGPP